MEATEHLNILSSAKAYGLVELEEAENEEIRALKEKIQQMEGMRAELDELKALVRRKLADEP